MNFDYSEKVQELREELMQFMDEHVYPNEKTYREQLNAAESRWTVPPDHGRAQGEGQSPRPVEPLSTRSRSGRGADQPRVRAAVRDHGPFPHRSRGLQLLGSRHGQYGSPDALRDSRAAGEMAQASPRG